MNKIWFILVLFLVLISCQNNKKLNETFVLEEELIIKNKTEEIINEFGYNNYKIFTYYHRELSNSVHSKAIKSNKAVGDGLLPLIDSTTGYGYTLTTSDDFEGYFEQREIIMNYKDETKVEIVYGYISILIIFNEITKDEKHELLKLLNLYIINGNRGDIVYIVSRNELQNKY